MPNRPKAPAAEDASDDIPIDIDDGSFVTQQVARVATLDAAPSEDSTKDEVDAGVHTKKGSSDEMLSRGMYERMSILGAEVVCAVGLRMAD